jgi:excisionase family DNA binding protein
MMIEEEQDRLLTVKEVAGRLRMSESWVLSHARGAYPPIRAIRMGKRVRFRETDVREFIQRCQTEIKTKGWAA